MIGNQETAAKQRLFAQGRRYKWVSSPGANGKAELLVNSMETQTNVPSAPGLFSA